MIANQCKSCRNFGNTPPVTTHPPPISFLDKSIQFDGIDDYVNLNPSPVSIDPIDDFTIQAWIKPTFDAAIYARVIQTPDEGVGGWGTAYSLGLGGNTNLHETDSNAFRMSFGIKDSIGEIVMFTSEPVIVPDIWTHIIAIWDDTGREIKIYVNGVSQLLYPGPAIIYAGVTNLGLNVGWNTAATSTYIWKGNLCDIAYIERVVTAIEAESLHIRTVNLEVHSVSDKLESWWKLGTDDTFPTLKDSKGINHLTMINMDAGDIVSDVPFSNNPSPHRDTHRDLNTDPLKVEAGGHGFPLLQDHFILSSTGSLNIGAGWGSDFSTDGRQIRWYGSEAGHPGVVSLDNFGLAGNADEYASIMFGGSQGTGTLWNYVLDEPHFDSVNPNPGPLTMEWLVRFPLIGTAEIERGAFGWGDRFETTAPLAHPVHDNGFYIEFDPSIDSHFRLIATKTTGGVVTQVVTGTTVIVASRWYKISAILRYEILTSGAISYTPKMTLLVNDQIEGTLTPITALPDDTANLAFGARFDSGTNPTGTQNAPTYKAPTCPRVDIDWVIVTQVTAGPTHT